MSPPGDRREPLADTKCPPAAQRKQANTNQIQNYSIILAMVSSHLLLI